LSLTGGLLLGLPWSVSSLFFAVFVAWVPLLVLEEETRHHPNRTILFNYAFLSFLLWNVLGTWWITQAQWLGAILILLANALVQALIFWSISRVRTSLNIPLLFPFLMVWMGYECYHESWDLAWPWLNLGNALATAPKLIQWVEYTGVRGSTLWIILTNFAIFKMAVTCRERGLGSIVPMGAVTVLLVFIPALVSYQMFINFREEGETVTVALGPVADELRRVFDIVLTAHDLALAAVAPGVPVSELDRVAREHIAAAGYGDYFGHGLGHGVGLEVHEAPTVSSRSKAVVQEGMVFTVEPGIYLPGVGGVRIEDMVLATATGSRVLTRIPKQFRNLLAC